jgi:formate dehydrogenase maturation protein FdhE
LVLLLGSLLLQEPVQAVEYLQNLKKVSSQPLTLLALPLLQLAFAPAASPQAWFVWLRPSAIHQKANQRSESM